LQNRARFKNRDWSAAVARRTVNDRGHTVVGRKGEKLRLELVTSADVDGMNPIIQPSLLQEHRDLVAIGSRPVI
jgi:hypothetical protein